VSTRCGTRTSPASAFAGPPRSAARRCSARSSRLRRTRRAPGIVLPNRPRPQQRRAVAVEYELWWLPRGENNSEPNVSDSFSSAPGSVRYANVLAEVSARAGCARCAGRDVHEPTPAGDEPHLQPSATGHLGRTARRCRDHACGADPLRRAQADPVRHRGRSDESNIGCQNATDRVIPIDLELFDMEGSSLGTERMILPPWGTTRSTGSSGVRADHRYVEVSTPTRAARSTARFGARQPELGPDHDPADVTNQRPGPATAAPACAGWKGDRRWRRSFDSRAIVWRDGPAGAARPWLRI